MYDNVILLCQEAFALARSAKILTYYAKAYLESNSATQAVLLCKQNINLIWESQELFVIYVQSLLECGKFTDAEAIIQKSYQNFPEMEEDIKVALKYYTGLICTRTHRHEDASKYYEEAVQMNSSIVSIIPKTSDKFQPAKQKNENKNKSHLLTPSQIRERKSIGSKLPIPKKSIPISTQLLKKPMSIIEMSKKLPSEMQDSILVLLLSAEYYFRCSKYTEAAAIFSRLYEIHPHTVLGVDIYSTTLWQLKDEKKLNEVSRRALEIAPNKPESWVAAGNLLSIQHNSDAAVQMFQRAAGIDHSCSYPLALAGHELLLLDSLSEASKLFRESIDRNPQEWSAWYGLGSVHFKQDNFGAAQYYMRKALDANPDSSVLHYVYAMILRKCGNEEEASEHFDLAISLDPSNLVPVFQKGVMAADSGDPIEALELLNKAESLAPHEPGIAYTKAVIAESLGDTAGAAEMYTNALVFGHPEKKEIHSALEKMMDSVINNFLS
ncbi:TPR Domain containing protein [Trichomonas vaginalis G3]|uniref:TPR Domain containing protein n=1 Tax=Trichomonas vaginalis (strain ATCC PRA-98 / G3) TaxID=412133 RepID=A2F4U8_TRIV3|nr:metaphase/anaphase transition of mitotic cell cycle [Trichomonas vaginalis G3]EAY00056.1 TPR Domain containing protein [Trichomonas vaginalis G3]KAI5543750.1 metaphase/anaphase transition of mitotic cell cycle [Trichomonas vaginalis G3]|eukprot:XP_001312985.1 TPR Domain containing protein [Trichomonas vaginalis G3]